MLLCTQFYCDHSQASEAECAFQPGAQSLAVFNIHYENITGTSNGTHGIIFNCSDTMPCRGIQLNNINVVPAGDASLVSHFHNVHGTSVGLTSPITPGQSWSPPAMTPQQWTMFQAQAAQCRYANHKGYVYFFILYKNSSHIHSVHFQHHSTHTCSKTSLFRAFPFSHCRVATWTFPDLLLSSPYTTPAFVPLPPSPTIKHTNSLQ